MIAGGAQILTNEVSKTAQSITTWLLPTLRTIKKDLVDKRLTGALSLREQGNPSSKETTASAPVPKTPSPLPPSPPPIVQQSNRGSVTVSENIDDVGVFSKQVSPLTNEVIEDSCDEGEWKAPASVPFARASSPIPISRSGLKRRVKACKDD